ncbi:hypothetical protein HII31_02729 [Pseudocercospora fuligena]|uniref:Uncharacterized protein n=1 Tax=Pseudocercospora fuligena TaxID=685502 RepID=A0A8H6RSC1_9PEZI|nr:hypothetical protein HII31_02729 [Pseudocercospora fuligena]
MAVPDLALWDADDANEWIDEAELGNTFEGVSEDQLIAGQRVVWTFEGITKVRAFCAKHQISHRNRPSPELLLGLVDQICILHNVTAFEKAANKVLYCIKEYVSNVCPALDEEQQSDGTWKCTWYRFSEAWFHPKWDGDVTPPEDDNAWYARPVVKKRHDMGPTLLIKAAIRARGAKLSKAVAAKEATKKAVKEVIEEDPNNTAAVEASTITEASVDEEASKAISVTSNDNGVEEMPEEAIMPTTDGTGTKGTSSTPVNPQQYTKPTDASNPYEIEEVLSSFTASDGNSFLLVKCKGFSTPLALPAPNLAGFQTSAPNPPCAVDLKQDDLSDQDSAVNMSEYSKATDVSTEYSAGEENDDVGSVSSLGEQCAILTAQVCEELQAPTNKKKEEELKATKPAVTKPVLVMKRTQQSAPFSRTARLSKKVQGKQPEYKFKAQNTFSEEAATLQDPIDDFEDFI